MCNTDRTERSLYQGVRLDGEADINESVYEKAWEKCDTAKTEVWVYFSLSVRCSHVRAKQL